MSPGADREGEVNVGVQGGMLGVQTGRSGVGWRRGTQVGWEGLGVGCASGSSRMGWREIIHSGWGEGGIRGGEQARGEGSRESGGRWNGELSEDPGCADEGDAGKRNTNRAVYMYIVWYGEVARQEKEGCMRILDLGAVGGYPSIAESLEQNGRDPYTMERAHMRNPKGRFEATTQHRNN